MIRTDVTRPAWRQWALRPAGDCISAAAECSTATTAVDIAAMVESGRCTTLLFDLAAELEPQRAAHPVGSVLDRLSSNH